jgi:glycerol-3-phosphate acyltransferase PlsX
MPRIAVDAMGGDFAPQVAVRGSYAYAQKHTNVDIVLVGREAEVRPLLSACGPELRNVALVHAPDVIEMHEHPVEALRKKKHNSLTVGCDLVRSGKADAIMSAGNTGGLVAASTLLLRTLPGVKKAGIATTLPSLVGRVVVMDVGANVEAKPSHLLQYAAMGEIFYRVIVGEPREMRVGLLTVGSEAGKGSSLVRESHALLSQSELSFAGNCEGHDIFEGRVEVAVCDGETGNVVLKTAEGVCDVVMRRVMTHAKSAELTEDPRYKQMLAALLHELDWREVGGAVLLGVNGVVVIAHGRSDEKAVGAAIGMAVECCNRRVNDQIVKALQTMKQPEAA